MIHPYAVSDPRRHAHLYVLGPPPPNDSYIDAAAEAGYATFPYDRLGASKSDRPDPVAVVQGPLQVELAHAMVQAPRSGGIAGHNIKSIVGTKHSVGKYPLDFDALVLTVLTLNMQHTALTFTASACEIASTDPSPRINRLSNGYNLKGTPQSIQVVFFKVPNFDEDGRYLFSQCHPRAPLLACCTQTRSMELSLSSSEKAYQSQEYPNPERAVQTRRSHRTI